MRGRGERGREGGREGASEAERKGERVIRDDKADLGPL